MPDVEQLHLEDALENSPQTHHLLNVFEKDASKLRTFTMSMQKCCQRIMSAQNELCAATQSLSQHLISYETKKFPLEQEDSVLSTTLKQFSSYLDDVSSMQQVLAQQFSETMMYPLNKFLQADIEEISTMQEMYRIACQDHEQSLAKYMKQPMKKDDKSRVEVNEELHANRKKFHQTSLHYYSSLNALQYKRKCFLLEPVMGYLHAQRACFQMGQDIVLRSDVEEFLGNIGSSVQAVHTDLAQVTLKTVEVIDNIEQQSQHMYYAEPPADMPFIPPNTNLTQKAGYLFCRGKQVLLGSRWERMYFFTQGGNLMSQTKDEIAGSLVIDLNEEEVSVESCNVDDRRHTFHIVAAHKKVIVLQAENYRERDEWIATLNNIVRDGDYVKGARSLSLNRNEAPSNLPMNKSESSDNASTLSAQSPIAASSFPSISASTGGPETLILSTPIKFDLVSSWEEEKGAITSPQSGQPKNLNMCEQTPTTSLNPAFESAAFTESFTIRFLGSMEVSGDRGEELVHGTIRQIMAARAIHNVFKMTESRMVVASEGLRLIDPASNIVKVEFALQDISFWSAHPDNNRLFGFITRNRVPSQKSPSLQDNQTSGPMFACHVFECNTTAEDICQSISTATKIAYQALVEKRKLQAQGRTEAITQQVSPPLASVPKMKGAVSEKDLLLQNIGALSTDSVKQTAKMSQSSLNGVHDTDGENGSLPLSHDGKFLILQSSPEDEEEESATVDEEEESNA